MKKTVILKKDLESVSVDGTIPALDGNFKINITSKHSLDRFNKYIYGNEVKLSSSMPFLLWKAERLKRESTYYYLVLPSGTPVTEVEIEEPINIAEKVLAKHKPNQYFIDGRVAYIHYPVLTIANSAGWQHTIHDLVVRLEFNEEGLLKDIKGKRYSYAPEELRAFYAHSHLKKLADFGNFCLGGGSNFESVINSLKYEVNEHSFEYFLFQLDLYLTWESLEGGPHRLIADLSKYKVEDNNSLIFIVNESLMQRAVDLLLNYPKLDSFILFFNEYPIVNLEPPMGDNSKELLSYMSNHLTDNQLDELLVSLDVDTNEYVTIVSTVNANLPFGEDSITAKLKFKPKLLPSLELKETRNLIRVFNPNFLIELEKRINKYFLS